MPVVTIPTIKAGTTPTFTCRLPQGTDTSLFQYVYFALRQRGVLLMAYGDAITIDGVDILVSLTQEQTVKLGKGKALIELDWTYPDGKRGATKQKEINVEDTLIEVILE